MTADALDRLGRHEDELRALETRAIRWWADSNRNRLFVPSYLDGDGWTLAIHVTYATVEVSVRSISAPSGAVVELATLPERLRPVVATLATAPVRDLSRAGVLRALPDGRLTLQRPRAAERIGLTSRWALRALAGAGRSF